MVTKHKLQETGWEVLPRPHYSPDLVPTDFHLFLSLSNSLSNKILNNETELKNHIQTFIDPKPPDFYSQAAYKMARSQRY